MSIENMFILSSFFKRNNLTWILFFFFFISNKNSLIFKKETPKHTGSIQGKTSQERKLQESSKSKIEKGWFLHTGNQSSKVRIKRCLMLGIARPESSKHLLFISFQIHHIKQGGTTFQITPLQRRPKWHCQQAKSPTTDKGMTQLTPNKPKTISHNSEATGQWRWLTLSLLHLHI